MAELSLSPASKFVVSVLSWGSSGLFAVAIVLVFLILAWKGLKRQRSTPSAVASPVSESSAGKDCTSGSDSGNSIVALSLEGMTSSNCSSAVESTVRGMEGVMTADVQLLTHKATVTFRSPATADTIVAGIEIIGFGAAIISVGHADSELLEPSKGDWQAVLEIEGMTCSQCSSAVERALSGIDGVSAVDVNLLTHKATVRITASLVQSTLVEAVEAVGFGAAVLSLQVVEETPVVTQTEAVVSVQGMTCSQCSGALERVLRAIEGVSVATIDLLAHRATVTFSAPCDSEQICSAVEAIGFDASVISCVEKSPAVKVMRKSASRRFSESLGVQSKACLLRISFDSLNGLRSGREALKERKGVAGVVVARNGAHELRISYWSHEVGARDLLDELSPCGAKWAGDSRLNSDKGRRGERVKLVRWLVSVPFTGVIFVLAMIIPNLFPEADDAIKESVCCGGALTHQTLWLILLSLPVQFGVAWPMHRSAVTALRTGHLSMDVLISLGTNLAFVYSVVVTIVWVIIGIEAPGILTAGASHGQHSSHIHHSAMTTKAPANHNGHGASTAPPPHFFEASAMLLSILMLGKLMESHAKRKTGDALRRLASQFASEARLAEGDIVPCDLLQVDDTVAVSDGEMVPCDGWVVSGELRLDESCLTGEDRPVRKERGDFVVGGSKCVDGAAHFKASAVGANTAMSQVAAMVEAAQSSRLEIERLGLKVAAKFVPTILGLALITFITWVVLLTTGVVEAPTALANGHSLEEARLAEQSFFVSRFALALMMMACPCAFGLAAPTAVLVATGHVARWGCLIKSGRAIELGQALKAVVLDKTGTVTVGKPKVTLSAIASDHPALTKAVHVEIRNGVATRPIMWLPSSCAHPAKTETPSDAQMAMLWLAVGSVEAPSQHPLGKALTAEAQRLIAAIPEAQDWHSITGCGVEGQVPGLGFVRVGRRQWVCKGEMPDAACKCGMECRCSAENNSCGCRCWEGKKAAAVPLLTMQHVADPLTQPAPVDTFKSWFTDAGVQGSGVVAVSLDGEMLGGITLRDVLQPGARDAVAELQCRGIEVWLCSGDQKSTTEAIAKEMGIKHWVGEALPTDKATLVQRLCADGKLTGFVGDGVNDAPALAAASLGVAIGAGAHVTVEAADVVLVRSMFSDFLEFLRASQRTLWTIKTNYVWAFLFNLIGLPLAAGVAYPTVHLPPVLAGAAMAGSSLMVVGNSLLLRRRLGTARTQVATEILPKQCD